MRVYVVYVEYCNFEDIANNWTEILGVYDTRELALQKIKEQDETETSLGMIRFTLDYESIDEQLNRFGYVSYNQEFGSGESIIVLEEHKLQTKGVR